MRTSLLEKNRSWTYFEKELFNLLGKSLPQEFLFSKRLAATDAMLKALDDFVEQESQCQTPQK